jgi:palmitoyltransferase
MEHHRSQKGNVEAWVNQASEDGFSALHLAAYRGNLSMIEYLVENGANMYAKNRHGMNAMHIAA